MKIGRIVIHRSSKLRKLLTEFRSLREERHDWWRTLGIYQSRIFGICIYRNEVSVNKTLKKILNENSGPQGNDH